VNFEGKNKKGSATKRLSPKLPKSGGRGRGFVNLRGRSGGMTVTVPLSSVSCSSSSEIQESQGNKSITQLGHKLRDLYIPFEPLFSCDSIYRK